MKPRCSELSHVMGLLGAVVLGLVGIARADIPGYEKSEFMVSMRDGVRLHTLVYRPVKQERSLPIMLMRTPYGIVGGVLAPWMIISRTWPTRAIFSPSRISAAGTSPRASS